MICVGLTGGIGSGKSYISLVFRTLGISVYDSDSRARELSNTNSKIRREITSLLGTKAYKGKELDRQYVGEVVFNQPDLLAGLNNIIHPAVEEDFLEWCGNNNSSPYLIKEAAILFETGSYKKLSRNILVTAPEELRIKRLIERDQKEEYKIRNQIKNQWPDEDKLKLADFVIVNDGRTLILPQIVSIHNKIKTYK